MNHQDMEKEQVIRELIACQQRINELEALGTQQKETLLEAKTMFENLFESSPQALIVVDQQGRITRMNTEAERLFGYARHELIGADHGVLVPARFRAKHDTEMKNYTGQPHTRVMALGLEPNGRRKDGTEFPADIDLGPLEIGKELFVLSVVRDATKRKGLEDKLLESEQKYRELADLFPEIIFEADIQGTLTYANRKALDSFNISSEELSKGVNIFDYVTPEYRSFARQRFSTVLQEGDIGADEYVLLTKNGTTFPALVHSASITRQGRTLGIRGIAVDITERKKLEEELNRYRQRLEQTVAERTTEFAQANEKLTRKMEEHRKTEGGLVLRATILDNAREAIFLINPEGYFVYANEAAIKTYGYSLDEFLSMNLNQLSRTEEAPLISGRLKEVVRIGQMELETIHLRKDKSLMPVQVRHSLVKTLHGRSIVSVMRDMTNEFRLRLLLERMPGMLWATDSRLSLTASSNMAKETAGLKPGEGVGMPLAEYLEKNGFGAEAMAAHQRALAGASTSFEVENKRLDRTFYGWAAPLLDTQGKLVGTISVAVDVTEYKPEAR